ncbi:hypothetical protein PWP93_30180 [Paraburkholderia sp. A1RI-2L]|uniref:hypothetical protein n=1 Tax=Paraburkholderia sp. A1RI-2L TaxID=3028367 RepID=UPI003B819E5A
MNFVDTVLIRLADPAARGGVFDSDSLAQIASTAYDTSAMPIQGPYSAVFDDIQLGLAVPRVATLDGYWGRSATGERTDSQFVLSGLGESAIRVDAFWRGAIIARSTPPTGHVSAARGNVVDAGQIDAEIVAALGALPADSAALENERRTRLLTHLRAAFAQPDLMTGALLDQWLRDNGASSVSDLIVNLRGVLHAYPLQITFSPPNDVPSLPEPLPIGTALMIRDVGFSVGDLLTESRIVRQQLGQMGLTRAVDATLPIREPLPITWIVPAATFDDTGWPGAAAGMAADAARSARRAAAAGWLVLQGIGLAVV